MGSACHQRGVYQIHRALEEALARNGLTDRVELKGAFCLGPCMNSIVLKVGDQLILNVTPDNFEQKFADEILPLLADKADDVQNTRQKSVGTSLGL